MLRWVGYARYGSKDPDSLHLMGELHKEDRDALRRAGEFLLHIRNELQFHSGKAHDILDKCEQRISTHSLADSSPVQQARIKEAMISASAAEVMAPFQSIDPEVGFSAAILRQLGTALIAWNYPSVYQRCLERNDLAISIDAALNDALGFSPTVFGAYLLGRWGVASELRIVVGSDPTGVESEPMTEMQQYLKKICEVGEALSRAQSPEYYPSAESDWEIARSTIEGILGPEGMRSVQEHVRNNCENYRAYLKQQFSDTAQLNPGARLVACRDEHLNDRNQYIKGCLPNLKKSFRELYAQMDINTISQHSVRALTNDLIPLAGFTGGCVFVLDPASRQFIPRLIVGKVALRKLGPVAYSEYSSKNDPVIIAFDCQTPMIEHSKTGAVDDPACIAAVLGSKQRLGVLYLEIPQTALNDFDQNVLMHFKAVRKALEDALHIS